MKLLTILVFIMIFASGCTNLLDDSRTIKSREPENRAWTVIVYMAADNDLEAAAIADFNELEAVEFAEKPVSVLVLLDRSAGHDATNGDWTDTRLYEIIPDANGNNATLISPRIDCPDLGLTTAENTELDMSDPLVLQRLIAFAKREYTADNYALIVWGHGTGWRGGDAISADFPEPLFRAVAIDDTTNSYMPLSAFGNAVSGSGLSVIGFDTCFAATLEVAYQLKDSGAQYMVGSAGMVPANGWNYIALFDIFLSKPAFTVDSLTGAIIKQFSDQYGGVQNTSISRIKLSEVEKIFGKFEAFAGTLAENINTASEKELALNTLLNSTDSYFAAPPSDLYVDLYSFAEKIKSMSGTFTTGGSEINKAADDLKIAVNAAITGAWAQNSAKNQKQIGVFFSEIIVPGTPKPSHSLAYTRGSMSMNKSAFVENSVHWVPNNTPNPASLLDKLFYLSY